FALAESMPEINRLEHNDPLSDEELDFLLIRSGELSDLFDQFPDLVSQEGRLSLSGIDGRGIEYLVTTNTGDEIDEETAIATNTRRSKIYMIAQYLHGSEEEPERHKLEIYTDMTGEVRYELEGTDFTDDDSKADQMAKFTQAVA